MDPILKPLACDEDLQLGEKLPMEYQAPFSEHMPLEAVALLGLVDTYLLHEHVSGPPRGHERYHPSAFGKCLRLMQYQRYEERGYVTAQKKLPTPSLCRVFGNGHGMHDRWREYFEKIGVLRGVWQCNNYACAAYGENDYINPDALHEMKEQPEEFAKRRRWYGKDELQGCFKPDSCVCGCKEFTYHEVSVVSVELNFYGHADMILDFSRFDPAKIDSVFRSYRIDELPKKPIVVDMKSINMFGYKVVDQGKPAHYYLVQLMIYANILDCEYGVLIYENKNDQLSTAYRVNPQTHTLFELIRRQASEMNDMVEVVDAKGNIHHLLPPPRPADKNAKECNWCQFKDQCHESPIWDEPDFNEIRKDFYGELLDEDHE